MAALNGDSHQELIQKALDELIAIGGADRFGVWLETEAREAEVEERTFRGIVWDRENEFVPREWSTISPHAALPLARLLSGLAVETNTTSKKGQMLVGPLAGLHSALWTPVQHAGKLCGILMAGSLGQNRSIKEGQLQRIASELTVALALETERRLANERHADLALSSRVLSRLQENAPPENLLAEILESCVAESSRRDNIGVRIAFLGKVQKDEGANERARLVAVPGIDQNEALPFAQMGAVQELAKRALEMKRTIGNELTALEGERLRVIAVPLEGKEEFGNVLIAGFRAGSVSLGSLERIELRGKLAVQVLCEVRKKTERAQIREREQAILEASGTPMVLVGQEGFLIGSNRAGRALLQFPAGAGSLETDSALPGRMQFSDYFSDKDRERVAFWQKNRKAEGARADGYLEAKLLCGARVKLRAESTRDDSQAIALLPAETSASPEEGRTQAELLSLTEWLDQGVILFDAEENVRLLNLRFAQLAGLAAGETDKYKTLESLVERLRGQSAEPETFSRKWRELARRATEREREEIHFLKPMARVLERTSRPILNLAGNRLGRIELYRDLTAQRMFQAKLLQTERLAALGQMVSGVAHELSNPLTSILGYAQRLMLRNDAAEHFEEIRKIFAEAERGGAILRRMLLAVREPALERRVVPLNEIVQRTIELQRFSLAAERIRLELQLAPELPQVVGDAGQLQQVLMNLLGNARQAIESQGHGGTIRVHTRRTEDNRVRLEVSDSGPGIPEGILARIFDPFFTTKPAGVGTGLGLSIVLSLVREHGGQVHVLSPRGSGAEFIVELPAAGYRDLQEHAGQTAAAENGYGAQPTYSYSRPGQRNEAPRVLVVEDEPTVAQLISDVLRDEGFETEIHLDGRDAAHRAANEAFDLIICDMKMPNLDGQSLYESLDRSKGAQKRFLFVTGDALGAKTHEFLRKNRLPHVAKPFRVEELLEKVHQVLQPDGNASARRVTPLRKNTATTG